MHELRIRPATALLPICLITITHHGSTWSCAEFLLAGNVHVFLVLVKISKVRVLVIAKVYENSRCKLTNCETLSYKRNE